MAISGGGEIINAPGQAPGSFGQNMLQLFMAKLQMDQQKEQMKMEKQRLKLQEDQVRQEMQIAQAKEDQRQREVAATDRAAMGRLNAGVTNADPYTLDTLRGAGALNEAPKYNSPEDFLRANAAALMPAGPMGFSPQQAQQLTQAITPQRSLNSLQPGEATALLGATNQAEMQGTKVAESKAATKASEASTFATYREQDRADRMFQYDVDYKKALTRAANAQASRDLTLAQQAKKEMQDLDVKRRQAALASVRGMDESVVRIAASLKQVNPQMRAQDARTQAATMVYGVPQRPDDKTLVDNELLLLGAAPKDMDTKALGAYYWNQKLSQFATRVGWDVEKVNDVEDALSQAKGDPSAAFQLMLDRSPGLNTKDAQGDRNALMGYLEMRTGKGVRQTRKNGWGFLRAMVPDKSNLLNATATGLAYP